MISHDQATRNSVGHGGCANNDGPLWIILLECIGK